LFVKNCGSCHTFEAAGTQGTIGPNLDDAFSSARNEGFDSSTIQQIVIGQIRQPLQGRPCPKPESLHTLVYPPCTPGVSVSPVGKPVMPANLVKGQDAVDVAAFVALCAGESGVPQCSPSSGTTISATNGKAIFLAAGCGGCHTLGDAGTRGTVGPNLDQAKPTKSLVVKQVTEGKGAMPSFKQRLTPKQIDALADYVASSAGAP
jgi:mono/diheme cytochrome c family protein